MDATLVIDMDGNATSIKNPSEPDRPAKTFTFDHSYWSHDGYTQQEDGHFVPTGSRYADQDRVFKDLGMSMLDHAWQGYNTTLFAYGQTGSGKSYSMTGAPGNDGIIPRCYTELFSKIEEKLASGGGDQYEVTLSMLEVYREQLRDLLQPASSKNTALRIRQHRERGDFYAEGLTHVGVNSLEAISQKVEEGIRNRTIAATQMNATSSRAHAVITITFKQFSNASGRATTKTSMISLVDMAGSERGSKTAATGDRLRESQSINQSLSSMGNVISALAQIASGKDKVFVPYRDSVMTRLLKNALGGNSKAVMLAALSPADNNYDESLSTLRYANRAKCIQNKPEVNETATDDVISGLQEENAKLRKMLSEGGLAGAKADADNLGEVDQASMEKQKADFEAKIHSNRLIIDDLKKSPADRMKEREKEFLEKQDAKNKENEKKKVVPHLWNLNKDPSLTHMLNYFCNSGETLVGMSTNEKSDIKISGVGVGKEHAVISNSSNAKVTVKPRQGCKVYLNGHTVTVEKELHHHDVVMFGVGENWFVLHHPQDLGRMLKEKKIKKAPTYEEAEELMSVNSGMLPMGVTDRNSKETPLQQDLMQTWKLVCEANAMAEELDKKVKFELALLTPYARGLTKGRTETMLKMKDTRNGCEFMFAPADFAERMLLMQDMHHNFQHNVTDWNKPEAQDPFYEDSSTPVLIGSANMYLEALAYKLDMVEDLKITDYVGTDKGQLSVKFIPCDKNGKDLNEDDFVDDPSELIGTEFNFKLCIETAKGIPKRFTECFAQYQMETLPNIGMCKTKTASGSEPAFGYERVHTFTSVTKEIINSLQNKPLHIEVWGRQLASAEESGRLTTPEVTQKDDVTVQGGASQDQHYYSKLLADAKKYEKLYEKTQHKLMNVREEGKHFKKSMEKAENKLTKIGEVCEKASKERRDTQTVKEVEKILKGGRPFGSLRPANVPRHNNNSSDTNTKSANMGMESSQACVQQ